jgi:hypothetical protein
MLSNFYTAHSSIPPQASFYPPPSNSSGMNTSVSFLTMILLFTIAIAIAFHRGYHRGFQQDKNEQDEIQHQREVLERIWKMRARK